MRNDVFLHLLHLVYKKIEMFDSQYISILHYLTPSKKLKQENEYH